MKIPRDLYGAQLAAALCSRWNYTRLHQTGSHIILETGEPAHHRISVPAHKPLRLGTLNSILRAISTHKGVSRDEILRSL